MDKFKNRLFLLLVLLTITAKAQVSMNFGVTEISNRFDGNTLTWSVGYTEMINSFGLKANYRQANVKSLNYQSVDLMGVYAITEKSYRFYLGAGGSWNDVNFKINPIVSMKNAFKIDKGLFVTIDVEGVFRENFITHGLVGLLVDVYWLSGPRKPKRFF